MRHALRAVPCAKLVLGHCCWACRPPEQLGSSIAAEQWVAHCGATQTILAAMSTLLSTWADEGRAQSHRQAAAAVSPSPRTRQQNIQHQRRKCAEPTSTCGTYTRKTAGQGPLKGMRERGCGPRAPQNNITKDSDMCCHADLLASSARRLRNPASTDPRHSNFTSLLCSTRCVDYGAALPAALSAGMRLIMRQPSQ